MRTEVRGGGCLDGARLAEAGHGTLHCGASWWALDDDTGEYVFTGLGGFGREMAIMAEEFRMDQRQQRQAAEEAARPRSCTKCGRTYADAASFTVAHDPMWPGCVPPEVAGLEEVDGVWRRIRGGR